jgi:hypothetical protein
MPNDAELKARVRGVWDLMIARGFLETDGRGRARMSAETLARTAQLDSPEFIAANPGLTEEERFFKVFPELLNDAAN